MQPNNESTFQNAFWISVSDFKSEQVAYEPTEKRFVSIAYYAYDAHLMSKMSSILSKLESGVYSEKTEKFNRLFEDIKKYFQEKYVGSDGYLTENSQTAYLLALK